jgi:hypothetical protein
MRLNLAVALLPIVAVAITPLACSSSTTSDDSAANDGDAGDTGDSGDTTDTGTTTNPDASGPFTPGAYPGGYPQVPNNGSAVMSNFSLVAIIPSGEDTVGLNHFADTFAGSTTFQAVSSEYGLGTPTASTMAGSAMTAGENTTNQIQTYITDTIGSPASNTIYLVFMPATSWLEYGGVSQKGCHANDDPNASGVGGYHVPFGGNAAWGVVQHCTGDPTHTDSQLVEIAASHEVVEAATDKDGVSGYALPAVQQASDWPTNSIWDDLLLTEIGDLCVSTEYTEGSYTFQRFWSNKAAASSADPCIPAIPIYFNTATVGADANGWFKATGSTLTIPIEGFSTAALAPWIVASATGSSPAQATANGFVISVNGTGTSMGQPSIGNGEKGSVVINIPSAAQSGDWAAFELESASSGISVGENFHVWPFGVYVP